MRKLKYLLCILGCVFLFGACSSDSDDTPTLPGEIKDITFIDVSSYTEWVYFSFSKGEVVNVSDYTNDLTWDIAFHRGDIRLNGGASGKGKAEVVNTNQKDWSAVTQAPTSGYQQDQIGEITTAFTGSGITTENQPFSQTLSGWLSVDTSNPPPKYTVNGWIYVLKSADGKYVKLLIYDNKNEKNSAGYVSFKYQYNESGSDLFI